LEGWPLSPFLNTGATIAVFQSDGILLWLMDAWNINVSAGVISLAVSFSYFIGSVRVLPDRRELRKKKKWHINLG
jgi:hypothetical protein